jgi:hypothetical protein
MSHRFHYFSAVSRLAFLILDVAESGVWFRIPLHCVLSLGMLLASGTRLAKNRS